MYYEFVIIDDKDNFKQDIEEVKTNLKWRVKFSILLCKNVVLNF